MYRGSDKFKIETYSNANKGSYTIARRLGYIIPLSLFLVSKKS